MPRNQEEKLMSENLTAASAPSIAAARNEVWEALVRADAIKQYMFTATVESDWSEGSRISGARAMEGKKGEDKGIALKIV